MTFVDVFLYQLAAGGVVIDVTALRTTEQAVPLAEAIAAAPPCSRVVMFFARGLATRFVRFVSPFRGALAGLDLTHVIDTSGAYIPGHGMPTMIVVARTAPPLSSWVRVLRCVRGEPRKPEDPAQGLVWQSILRYYDRPGEGDEWTRCADVPRSALGVHPWRFEELVP